MTTVTLIEGDTRIRSSIQQALGDRGYEVARATSGLAGLSLVVDGHPDVVLLDLGLPDLDGLDVLKMLRAVSTVPVIVTTTRDDERDTVIALRAGADDYLVKPFSLDHLDARLQAVLRRLQPDLTPAITVGGLRIDRSARVATLDGELLDLTRKEFELLSYLAVNAGRVVTKRELMAAIWDQPCGGADKTIDVHLSWLRHKLGESAAAPRYLKAFRGVGVKLVVPRPVRSLEV